MKRKSALVTALALALVTISDGAAQAAPPGCTDIRNGRLCISTTPVGQNGHVRVTYEKKSGSQFVGHLEWKNPAGRVFKSPDITMYAGRTYYHTWPTWVGSGCNKGFVYNKSAGESSETTLCV
jgi:hypothetical protein